MALDKEDETHSLSNVVHLAQHPDFPKRSGPFVEDTTHAHGHGTCADPAGVDAERHKPLMPAVLAELVVAIATEMVGVKVTVRAWRAEGASVGRLTERKETRAAVTMMIALEAAMAALDNQLATRQACNVPVVALRGMVLTRCCLHCRALRG